MSIADNVGVIKVVPLPCMLYAMLWTACLTWPSVNSQAASAKSISLMKAGRRVIVVGETLDQAVAG